MPAHVPAPSRILEGHRDLVTFRAQLEHIRYLLRRMGGEVLSATRSDDPPEEYGATGEPTRPTPIENAAVPRILECAASKPAPSPRRKRGRTILMAPIRVCFGKL